MKPISNLSYLYLSSFGNPACDRVIYRTIKKYKVSSIIEIGVGNGKRAETMIRIASKYSGSGNVRYTGIDGFEANPGSQIKLKDCHQRLSRLDCKLQLVPGDLVTSITRIANSHVRTDLLIISSEYNVSELESVWYYVPRMLHAASNVFLQESDDPQGYFEKLGRLEIERRLQQQPSRAKQAA